MTAEEAREVRAYRAEDLPAITRLWREIGWLDDSEREAAGLAMFLDLGAAEVGVVDGEAECLVHRTPGSMRYDDVDLSLCAITAVTTGTVVRNLGLASRVTPGVVAEGARDGAAVAALGMFEQGFYNRFGFGSLGYIHQLDFDPSHLRIPRPERRPVRIGRDDWAEMADLMTRRQRRHGGVVLDPPESVQAEMQWVDDPFLGLGFRGEDGRLTAAMVGTNTGEHGPYKVSMIGYEGPDDLRDLLGLLRVLAAQLHSVVMMEPPGVQLQDVIDLPVRGTDLLDVDHKPWHEAMAWYQARILDLETCVAARRWPGAPVSFDLVLADPLSDLSLPWPGLSGDYSVTVGDPSEVSAGHRGGLPRLRASIGAFSRLWLGVQPATGLAITDDLDGPPDLLTALDHAFVLPSPTPALAF